MHMVKNLPAGSYYIASYVAIYSPSSSVVPVAVAGSPSPAPVLPLNSTI